MQPVTNVTSIYDSNGALSRGQYDESGVVFMTQTTIAKSVASHYYGSMGMRAVVVFLRELRVQQKISQSKLADAMDLSLRQTQRWENGDAQDLKAEQIIKAIAFLNAPFDQASQLLLDDDATDEAGKAFAKAYFTPADESLVAILEADRIERAKQALSDLTPSELVQVLIASQESLVREVTAATVPAKRRPALRLWRRGSTR